MIDSENLRTASLYINNQLLSRGLLHDGRGIDFADPGASPLELADTMGRIMGVVNDLILRRDRDAEHREALSTALRTMRADSLRQSDNLQRLSERYTEAQRKADLAEAEEGALRAQLKAAEAAIHKLKDEAARTKRLVAETRAACANEVRKRDRQIEGLKRSVAEAGRARGERKSAGITTIQVTGDFGGGDDVVGGAATAAASTMDEAYDLRQETNGFLAQLAKGLSEENESLLSLIRKTNESLKTMSGWYKGEAGALEKSGGLAIPLPTNPEDLAVDIEGVLDHLRSMLTNPSFVPLEEVVVREEEIFRLRDGWEKMEERWQEAVHLIDGWRRRMAANGRPVDMEDLKMGLRLSPVRVQDVDDEEDAAQNEAFKLSTLKEEEEEEDDSSFVQRPGSPSPPGSLHLVPAPGYEDMQPEYEEPRDELDDSDSESSIFHDDVDIDMEELDAPEPNVEILQQSATNTADLSESVSILLPPPPKITPLEEASVSGNRKPSSTSREKSKKRSGNLMEETGDILDTPPPPPPPPHAAKPGQSPQKRLKISADGRDEKPKSRPNSQVFTDSNDTSLNNNNTLAVKPSPPEAKAAKPSSSRPTTRMTTTTTQSDVKVKKSTPAPSRPTIKAIKSEAELKKDTPSKPLTRQRSTRATAATASSSAKTASSKPEPAKSSRPPPPTADMPPPPRPARAANNNRSLQPSPPSSSSSSVSVHKHQQATPTTSSHLDSPAAAANNNNNNRSPAKSSSRLPLPRTTNNNNLQQQQQSPLSMARIAAKLAASEREADAARVRAKLKAARARATREPSGGGSDAEAGGVLITAEEGEEEEVAAAPRKREVRSSRRRAVSRRRSTLSPWELQSLIAGDVQVAEEDGDVEKEEEQ